jgi:hypothetical protein
MMNRKIPAALFFRLLKGYEKVMDLNTPLRVFNVFKQISKLLELIFGLFYYIVR